MPRGKPAIARRRARVLALQGLYEADIAGHSAGMSLESLVEEAGLAEGALAYAKDLMEGVTRRRGEIDEVIYKFAPAWPVTQLPAVDRNILRLALFELRFSLDVPSKVAINEAVEMAKTFGSDTSGRFVNGVLGSVMDDMAWTEAAAHEVIAVIKPNSNQKEK
jgi:N utilization substance protein B